MGIVSDTGHNILSVGGSEPFTGVVTDNTLSGNGLQSTPLGVVNPYPGTTTSSISGNGTEESPLGLTSAWYGHEMQERDWLPWVSRTYKEEDTLTTFPDGRVNKVKRTRTRELRRWGAWRRNTATDENDTWIPLVSGTCEPSNNPSDAHFSVQWTDFTVHAGVPGYSKSYRFNKIGVTSTTTHECQSVIPLDANPNKPLVSIEIQKYYYGSKGNIYILWGKLNPSASFEYPYGGIHKLCHADGVIELTDYGQWCPTINYDSDYNYLWNVAGDMNVPVTASTGPLSSFGGGTFTADWAYRFDL